MINTTKTQTVINCPTFKTLMSKEKKCDIELYVPPHARKKPIDGINEVNKINFEYSNSEIHVDPISYDEISNCKSDEIENLTNSLTELSINKRNSLVEHLDYDKYKHILEIYDFDKNFKTFDFDEYFKPVCEEDFSIKWVDDNHCLLITESEIIAERVLSGIYSFKLRDLSSSTHASKCKVALSPGDWTKPYKRRPETDTFVAHRLISAALGVRPNSSLSKPTKLLDAKREKERIKQVQDSLWND